MHGVEMEQDNEIYHATQNRSLKINELFISEIKYIYIYIFWSAADHW